MIVRFLQRELVAKDTYSFYFEADQRFRYVAGQFVELTIPPAGNASHNKRWFTLSSSPTEKLLAITTRLKPDDVSTYKQTLLELEPNSELAMSEAMGDFILPIDQSLPLTFIAGGIGITPYRSMLQWLHDKQESRQISLYYGGRHMDHMPFVQQIKERVTNAKIITGSHLDVQGIAEDTGRRGGAVFVSGPEQMVSNASKELKRLLPRNTLIITDAFLGYN